jgi:hypothetical protein
VILGSFFLPGASAVGRVARDFGDIRVPAEQERKIFCPPIGLALAY